MQVDIKSSQELNYETPGACAFDFKSDGDYVIKSGEMVMVETGTAIKVPEGYMLQTASRSSTFKKLGLILVNAVGIIDNDYCGNDDTIKFQYLNLTGSDVEIKKGDRIGQGVFVKIEKASFNYVTEMDSENRGGFGSTGI